MKKFLLIALWSITTAWAQTGDEYVPKTQEQKVAQPAATPTAVAPHKITFYGVIDAGMTVADKVGTSNSSAVMYNSGAQDTSRMGITGTQDLGSGRSAVFMVETQIATGPGTNGTSSSSGSVNTMWNRGSQVGLNDKEYGSLLFGRQRSLIYQTFNVMDARGGKNFGSSLIFWADGSSFGGTSTAVTGLTTMTGSTHWSNAMRYDSPDFSGVKLSGMYVPGGYNDSDYGARYALTANYTPFKELTVVTGYSKINSSAGLTQGQIALLGGRWTSGPSTFAAGYTSIKNPSIAGSKNSDFTLTSVSMKRKMSPAIDWHAGVYNLADNYNSANGATMVSTSMDYYFAKQTYVYVGVSTMNNNGTSGFAPFGASGGANINSLSSTQYPSRVTVAGQVQNAITIGLSTSF